MATKNYSLLPESSMPSWLSGNQRLPLRQRAVRPRGSVVERVLGKNKVMGPIPIEGSNLV